MTKEGISRLASPFAAVLVTLAASAAAVEPGQHPYYLHALSDLRAARTLIEQRGGDAQMSTEEGFAIQQIDQTIGEIQRAAVDDGKSLHVQPPVDAKMNQYGKLHRAQELLQKARSDISHEEDDPKAAGLRDSAMHHLDEALRATSKAIADAQKRK